MDVFYLLGNLIDLFLWKSPYAEIDQSNPFFYTSALNAHTQAFLTPRRTLLLVGVLLLAGSGAYLAYIATADFIILAMVGVSLLAGIVVDFLCVLYGVNTIRSLTPMLPLLNVSNVQHTRLVLARRDAARVLAWRALRWLLVIRVVAVVMVGVGVVLFSLENLQDNVPLYQRTRNFGFYLGLYFTFSVYLLSEPLWRYRTMTTIGVYQAARSRELYRVWSSIFGSVLFGFYVWQAVILVGWQLFVVLSQMFFGAEVALRYLLPIQDYVALPFLFGLIAGVSPVVYMLLIYHSQRRFITVQQLNNAHYDFFHQRD